MIIDKLIPFRQLLSSKIKVDFDPVRNSYKLLTDSTLADAVNPIVVSFPQVLDGTIDVIQDTETGTFIIKA